MISVVIPVYNEEKSIARVLSDVAKSMKESFKEHEIIVINDGSTDKTAEVLEKEKGIGLVILTHPENIGYGKSLLDGILAARYGCIAIMDGDGSYSPEHIKRLYEYYPKYDMVVGARQGKEYKKGLLKKPARALFQYLTEYASGRKVPDVNSGLRIFKKDMVLKFKDSLCSGFSFTTTITLIFLLNHYYVKYIPIPYTKRTGKSKVRHFRDTLRTGQIIVESILYYNPVKLFLLLASGNAILGIIIGVINQLLLKLDFISIASAICIASFIPVFCIGLIADQLRKIYHIGRWQKYEERKVS